MLQLIECGNISDPRDIEPLLDAKKAGVFVDTAVKERIEEMVAKFDPEGFFAFNTFSDQ